MSNIRVRIAPSPSGNLHVGTARTALFNYLFAKAQQGKFILRVEDTDLARSQEQYLQNIYDGLYALGLQWDEGPDIGGDYGPYRQSERFDIYTTYALQLLKDGYAYKCYCTQEELDQEKESSLQAKQPYIYSKKCLHLSDQEKHELEKTGKPACIRFQVQPKSLVVHDLIRGEITFDTSLTGDFVIMKSDGSASYNFSVVVDDILMKISHVIRGEDHISNTPRQILIYEALQAPLPHFAHCGMILAPDRTKLSKRHGATAVSEYIDNGYLPEAMINFLALLGWSPPDGQEVKTPDELAQEFSLNRISPTPAIFDVEKLNWLNGQYIKSMPLAELLKKSYHYFQQYDLTGYSDQDLEFILSLIREPLITLSSIPNDINYFFGQDIVIDDNVAKEVLQKPVTFKILEKFMSLAEAIEYKSLEDVEHSIKDLKDYFADDPEIKVKDIMFALRASLTGRTKGADLKSVLSLLGKDRIIYRIHNVLTSIKH